jgi:WD40 repeat protein
LRLVGKEAAMNSGKSGGKASVRPRSYLRYLFLPALAAVVLGGMFLIMAAKPEGELPEASTRPDNPGPLPPEPPEAKVVLPRESSPLAIDQQSERFDWQPEELRAVFGTHHGRQCGGMYCLAYRPDGKWLASGGDDWLIRIHDAATLREITVLRGHTARVTAIAFSPDGNTLASVSGREDNTIRLWDLRGAPRQTAVLPGCDLNFSAALRFSADGKRLAVAGLFGGFVEVWDLSGEKPRSIAKPRHGDYRPVGVAFSRDLKRLVAGTQQNANQRLWEIAGDKLVPGAILEGFEDLCANGVFSPDEKLLALAEIGGGNRTKIPVRLWDMSGPTPRPAGVFHAARSPGPLAFSPDGKSLALSDYEGVHWLGLERTPLVRKATIQDHTKSTAGVVAFAPDGRTLACSFADGISLWDLTGNKPSLRGPFPGHSAKITALTLGPTGKALLLGCPGDTARLIERDRGLFPERALLENVKVSTFAPDGRTFATASGASVRLWSLRQGKVVRRGSLDVDHPVSMMRFSPNGQVLALAGEEGEATLWKLSGPQHLLCGATEPPQALEFTPDGARLAVQTRSEIVLWDVAAGKRVRTWKLETRQGALHLGERWLTATGDDKGFVRVWALEGKRAQGDPLFSVAAGRRHGWGRSAIRRGCSRRGRQRSGDRAGRQAGRVGGKRRPVDRLGYGRRQGVAELADAYRGGAGRLPRRPTPGHLERQRNGLSAQAALTNSALVAR